MPMLLVMPHIFDWIGGIGLLDLGDIILPSMLLSFMLRGLAMANVAALIYKKGQPALMYLVPTTLGSLILVSKRNGDFHTMWTSTGINEEQSYASSRHQAIRTDDFTGIGHENDPV
ncbi:hypothetical protein PsorP6_015342 [Peronosclerospora sorghi]|uniref:Uncharacterized protein n=1 Tax=Peronosclerospora sorghi TaxID=230839 RepID=A0ACC0VR38_9STRA|nr:hypothetical protein PsorP6_015342 [Peronosclerospora sorghi]